MNNTVNESAIKKLKLLFTIVDRPKGEFYLDVISQFQVNCQLAMPGLGTAGSELTSLLGLEPHKIRSGLAEKFHTIRGGKGVAFAVPFSSVIGVNLYQFLSDNRMGREASL